MFSSSFSLFCASVNLVGSAPAGRALVAAPCGDCGGVTGAGATIGAAQGAGAGGGALGAQLQSEAALALEPRLAVGGGAGWAGDNDEVGGRGTEGCSVGSGGGAGSGQPAPPTVKAERQEAVHLAPRSFAPGPLHYHIMLSVATAALRRTANTPRRPRVG